jgi:hypothetical protein
MRCRTISVTENGYEIAVGACERRSIVTDRLRKPGAYR